MDVPSSPPDEPCGADWRALARLFAEGQVDFRHRMGLSKSDGHVFYAPTAQAAEVRAQKLAVLGSPEADLYFVETDAGRAAFEEFWRMFPFLAVDRGIASDDRTLNRAATLALEPDWMLLMPPDWRLVWASVCFPTRWSLAGKAARPLPEIHGAVPGLNEELGRKIHAFFDHLAPGDGWSRANWGLSTSQERNQHPSLPYTPLADQTPLEAVHVRVESQHLLKLPGTGAVAFGIRILSFPLDEVRRRSQVLAGLRSQLRTMPGEVAAYKGIPADFWRRL